MLLGLNTMSNPKIDNIITTIPINLMKLPLLIVLLDKLAKRIKTVAMNKIFEELPLDNNIGLIAVKTNRYNTNTISLLKILLFSCILTISLSFHKNMI